MTKKILLLTLLFAAFVQFVNAIPAYHRPVVITQPDGTQLTIIGHGDEYLNYITTADGYTIVKGADSFYRYANVVDGKLVATDVIARDESARNINEIKFLAPRAKFMRPDATANQIAMRERMAEMTAEKPFSNIRKAQRKAVRQGEFRGLVILVNFSDKKFRLGDDANAVFDQMMNENDFKGFDDPLYGFQEYTGSVRDYFVDNSMGQYEPTFDVVGPVDIPFESTHANGMDNASDLILAALTAADDEVDFSEYDSDGDGQVDMFYVIFAGYAASYSGNSSELIWPHASNLTWWNIKHDNTRMGRYACSAELYGWEDRDNLIEGIGTIVHEFSHVLGFMDHYDTTYSGFDNTSEWDIMAGGSYFNRGRTPVGYSAFERYSAGFAPLELIDSTGERSLEPIHTSNKGYRMDTPQKTPNGKVTEYFVLENRKREKWDAYLPGEGMLITKIDSTVVRLWTSNQANSTSRTCVKLLRAGGGAAGSVSEYDPFPGKGNVTFITNESKVNLLTYTNKRCYYNIFDIKKAGDVVTFNVVEDGYNPVVAPENSVFYESFYFSAGLGGNDGSFKNVGTGELYSENTGWTGKNIHAANSCAVVGKSSFFVKEENIISPSITLEDGKNYKLSFSAAPYQTTSNEALNVYIAEGTGSIDVENVTLEKGKWNDFTVNLTGSGDVKIAWGRKKSAFYLDTISIIPESSYVNAIEVVTVDESKNTNIYNLAGQKVDASYKGVVIKGGKKYLQK